MIEEQVKEVKWKRGPLLFASQNKLSPFQVPLLGALFPFGDETRARIVGTRR